MDRRLRRKYLIWRIAAQFWETYWWIIISLIAGAAVGQAISQSNPDQKNLWHMVGIIGGLLLGVLISFLVWQKTPEHRVSRGDRYLFQKNYENATAMYTAAIALVPRQPIYFLRRGVAYQSVGNLTAALADYTQAIALKSNFAAAYSYRAGLYMQLRDFTSAANDYTVAIDLNVRSPEIYMGRAAARYWIEERDQALADLAKVLLLKPDSASAHYLSGKICEDQHNAVEAVAHYEKTLKLAPDYAKAPEIRQYLASIKIKSN